MRILLVEGSGRGFLNQYSHALALGLSGAGDPVRLVTGARDELVDWDLGIDKRACLADGLAGWWCLRRQVREYHPDVVHLQWIDRPLAALAFVRWVQAQGIAVVYTPHNILPHERRWLSLPLFRVLYRQVDRVVVRDRHLGWALEELLDTPQERLAYLPGSPNPLALPSVPCTPLAELAGRQPRELRLLFFGHGSTRKGLDAFLGILAAEDWPDNLHLVVAGEGVLAGVGADLLARAQERLRISVLNRYLAPSEVAYLFSGTDLLVMPYRKQCKSPLTDLAAAFRVPVLRSDRVQGAGFRDGEQGLTYPQDRPDRLAGLLRGLAVDPPAVESLRDTLAPGEPVQSAIQRLAIGHRHLYGEILEAKAAVPLRVGLVRSAVGRGL